MVLLTSLRSLGCKIQIAALRSPPSISIQSPLQIRTISYPVIRDWLQIFTAGQSHEQLIQRLDQENAIKIHHSDKECDFLGLVELFKDEAAVHERLQNVALGAGISVGLFTNPDNPLDTSRTPTFRYVVGNIFLNSIWMPRFSGKEMAAAIQAELKEDIETIFFPMFDADQSNSIDVMELTMGLIRLFRSFRSYDNQTDDLVLVKRKCLSPLFNNLCKCTGVDIRSMLKGLFTIMQGHKTLKIFLQSLLSDPLWLQMRSCNFFRPETVGALELCCVENIEPHQEEDYYRHCSGVIEALSNELFLKIRPFCDETLQSKLAFFIKDDLAIPFFAANLQSASSPHQEMVVVFLFLWKLMDHFLSKSTSLRHFFNEYHVPVVEDLKSITIQQLITDLDMTSVETRVLCPSVSLKRWYVPLWAFVLFPHSSGRFLFAVVRQYFEDVCKHHPTLGLQNYYDQISDGAGLEQFERRLFVVDHASQMADFVDHRRQAEIDLEEILYNSDSPVFGLQLPTKVYPGFSFPLGIFEELMKRYFNDGARKLDSPLFKRSCQVLPRIPLPSNLLSLIKSPPCRCGFAVSVATEVSPENFTMTRMAICKCT